jgi:integrase
VFTIAKVQSDRDYILMLWLLNTGCRIGETCKVRVEQILAGGNVAENCVLKATQTKSKQARRVFINTVLRKELARYLRERTDDSEWLFAGRGGKKHLNPAYGSQLVRKIFEAAAIDQPSHCCRRTFATNLAIRRGVSPFVLKQLMGHSSIQTTNVYVSVSSIDLQGAVETLNEEPGTSAKKRISYL